MTAIKKQEQRKPPDEEQVQDLAWVVDRIQQAPPEEPLQHHFKNLVDLIAPLGFKLAMTRLGDRGLAEDALQDAFEIVFQKLYQLKRPDAFKAWFCRIVLRCSEKLQPQEIPKAKIHAAPKAKSDSVERLTLAQLLTWLPRNDRNILILREVLKLSYEELAYTLRLPQGTVRSRLSKARRRAAELAKEYGYE